MKSTKGILKTCSRGHKFYKSSDCPVCPMCWSGYEREKLLSDFPKDLSAPVLRALADSKIENLFELTKFTETEIANLHGVGPNGIKKLKDALKLKGLTFKS